jgi:hypothetical protein
LSPSLLLWSMAQPGRREILADRPDRLELQVMRVLDRLDRLVFVVSDRRVRQVPLVLRVLQDQQAGLVRRDFQVRKVYPVLRLLRVRPVPQVDRASAVDLVRLA